MVGARSDLPSAGSLARIASRIVRYPLLIRVLICLVLFLGVVGLDVLTGAEVNFSLFYLLPVVTAALIVSRQAGEIFSLVSAATWGMLEVVAREYSAAWIPVWNSAVRLGFFVLVVELVVATRRAHEQQRELARADPLTGIANARVFREAVERALAHSRRSGTPFSVAYIDLDRFKHVNDTFGHSEGDAVLRYVATSMQAALRATDTLARLGGDEFAILFTDSEGGKSADALDRIRTAIASALEEHWSVGMTVGLVAFVDPPSDVDAVLHAADALMYEGKVAGRGIVMQRTWSTPQPSTRSAEVG